MIIFRGKCERIVIKLEKYMLKKILKITGLVTGIIIIFLIVAGIVVNIIMQFSKYKMENRLTLEKVELNGTNQWISLSELTVPAKKPVILFLHGGPGVANLSILNILCPNLEKNAVVVNWDQRGAGKSFNLWHLGEELSLEKNINDAHVLTKYIKEKYKVDKISLMGYSAGTVIGMMLIKRYPDDYNLFISMGQVVDGKRQELLSLDYCLKKAHEANNKEDIRELENISFDFNKPETLLGQTMKERGYLLKYGGVYHSYRDYWHEFKSLWHAKEYSMFDIILWPLGMKHSLNEMWGDIALINMETAVPKVEVPVVFFIGAFDMNTPAILVKEYYEQLEATRGKELVVFDYSAHGIYYDETSRFEQETIKAISKYAK
jgi:pimeloyl-ACP methyl ester carboxylesterase